MQCTKPITEEDELTIWCRFRQGDTIAFEWLMRNYFKVLYRYGTKYTPDEDFVKDCIQDLFVDLWQRRSALSETVTLKAYLMASLRRRIRRGALSGQLPFDEISQSDELPFEAELSIEDALIHQETTQSLAYEIKSRVEQLPRRQKEVVYLRFFEDLSREEIAQVMAIHPQSVSNLLQSAFKQIKSGWKMELFVLFTLGLLA